MAIGARATLTGRDETVGGKFEYLPGTSSSAKSKPRNHPNMEAGGV